MAEPRIARVLCDDWSHDLRGHRRLTTDYPARVRSGSDGATFERRLDLYAVRQPINEPAAQEFGGPATIAALADGTDVFTVHAGEPPRTRSADEIGPVYSAGPDGPLAIPTGRMLVRLADGVRIEDRRASFEAAGFEIDKMLSYAPNAAWLRPARGGVAAALPRAADLGNLPDVVHVEPQLLLQRALK
jgi:hypothetical protein